MHIHKCRHEVFSTLEVVVRESRFEDVYEILFARGVDSICSYGSMAKTHFISKTKLISPSSRF